MLKVTTKGLWLQELRELLWFYQDAAAALGARAFDPAAMATMGTRSNWPSVREPSGREQAASRKWRRIAEAITALTAEEQSLLRDCYEAIGVAADDRAKRYGATAGAVRRAWGRSRELVELRATLRGADGALAKKLRKRRDELEGAIGWAARAAAVSAHESYVAARLAQREREQRELADATDSRLLDLARVVEKVPSPSRLRAARVAALMAEMFELKKEA